MNLSDFITATESLGDARIAKIVSDVVAKFNPNHGPDGRFASGGRGSSGASPRPAAKPASAGGASIGTDHATAAGATSGNSPQSAEKRRAAVLDTMTNKVKPRLPGMWLISEVRAGSGLSREDFRAALRDLVESDKLTMEHYEGGHLRLNAEERNGEYGMVWVGYRTH